MNQLLNNWLGENEWIAWCISLKNSTKRRNLFTKWASDIDLTFSFWDATDKISLSKEDYEICDVKIWSGKKCPGATACRLSHTRCLDYTLNQTNKKYILIFEDDAGFTMLNNSVGTSSSSSNFSNKENLLLFLNDCKQHNWDSIWLGYYNNSGKNSPIISNYVKKCTDTLCTHAMIFKREFAIDLLDKLKNTRKSEPIDSITSDMMKDFITLSPIDTIVCQIDNESTIEY